MVHGDTFYRISVDNFITDPDFLSLPFNLDNGSVDAVGSEDFTNRYRLNTWRSHHLNLRLCFGLSCQLGTALLNVLKDFGFALAKALLSFERIFIGSPGLAQNALGQLETFARGRGAFDDPVFRDRYAEAALDVEDHAALYSRFADQLKRGETLGADVSMLKIWVTETYQRISELMIEVAGPDAVEFMNRMYTNPWAKLAPGRCRYGLLLGEDGFIRDDGVIGRMSDDLFHVTTTTGGAARVLTMMEDYLQTEWPDLDVWLTSTTEQCSTVALNGPNVLNMLIPLVEGVDFANFPHMSVAECTVAGLPARLFRLSFTGEVGFEINVPARHGLTLWKALMEAGKRYNICPYGTETMHVLRAEKGYIIVGQDTDGTVTPQDAGLSWAIGQNKPDFVGKRSLARPDIVAKGRKQLVGLLTEDGSKLEEGAQIVLDPNQPLPMKMVGHVTSSYDSTMGHPIALAVVEGGHDMMGSTVFIPMLDGTKRAKITSTVFYDPENSRLKA